MRLVYSVIILFLMTSVALLIRARFRSDRRQEYIFKPASAALVILVALLSFLLPTVRPAYCAWVTLGLVLSLAGDVALMLRTRRSFLAGLVCFALAQVVYSVAFTIPNGFHASDVATGAVLLVLGAAAYFYLAPGLGRLRGPVVVYILLICLMVNRAASTLFGSAFSHSQAWLLTCGAVLFWASDLMWAINRFRRPFKAEPTGLLLYYGGQLLIALTPSIA